MVEDTTISQQDFFGNERKALLKKPEEPVAGPSTPGSSTAE